MKHTLAIAEREIKSSFVTPTAYVVIAGFLLIAGFFFFTLLQQFNMILAQASLMRDINPSLNEWVITPYFQTLEIILIFLIPILTMRSIAEEKRSGTFELLITSPLHISEIVWGKFIGVSAIITLMLALSFVFPLGLIVFSDPEVPPIIVGFVGILIFSFSFAALGIAVSACTKSQTISGVVSLVSLLLFYVIDAPAEHFGETGAQVLKAIAPANRITMMLQGVVSGSDIVYFLSIIAVGLYFASRALESTRWRT